MVNSWPEKIGTMTECRVGSDLTGARSQGWHYLLHTVFADQEALQAYIDHPVHQEFVSFLNECTLRATRLRLLHLGSSHGQPDTDLHAYRRRRIDPARRHERDIQDRSSAGRVRRRRRDELAHRVRPVAWASWSRTWSTVLTRMQNDLFDVGADFATPIVDNPEFAPLRVLPAYVDRLEGWCDHYNEPLEKLRSFILPGGTKSASLLHVARTVARRAERSAWAAYEQHGDTMNVTAITLSQSAQRPAVHLGPLCQSQRW